MKEWVKDVIKRETEKCKVTILGEGNNKYNYGILPLESRFSPIYLDAVIEGLSSMMESEISEANTIVGIEAKGFLIVPSIAKKCDKNCVVIRKRDYKTTDQIAFTHKAPYGKEEKLFCVGLKKCDKIILFDDIVSGGSTVSSVTNKLVENKYEVVGIGTLYDRGNGRKVIKERTGFSPKSLATIDVVNGKVKVLSFYPENNLSD